MQMENFLNCPVCNLQLEFKYKRSFLDHIGKHDQLLQIQWPLKCCQLSCIKTFSNAIMYKKHVVKHIPDLNHGKILNLKKTNELIKNCSNSSNDEASDSYNHNMNETDIIEEAEELDYCDLSNEGIKTEIKNKAFKLINHFRAKNQLSNILLNEIISMFGDFINDLIEIVKDKTADLIELSQAQREKISDFYSIIVNPFDFMSSVYKQQNSLEDSGFYVAPRAINIGKRNDTLMKNGKSIIVSKDITFEYVSIGDTLEKLLENGEYLNTIKLYATNMVYDPSYYKSHPLFKNNKNLRIILYYDDLEMCNALGDSAGIYKGGMFYFTIANLTRKHYSNLKNIYLVAVSHSEDFKTFGYNSALELIMNDIKKLEAEGICIDNQVYYGSIAQCIY